MTLDNNTALVSGGTSGIGQVASVKALATAAAKALFTGRRAEQGQAFQDKLAALGYEVTFLQSDVNRPEQVSAMVKAAVDTYGRLDIAFQNAGVSGDLGPLNEQIAENGAHVMDINVRGVWLSMKEEIKAMLEIGGSTVFNKASVDGHAGFAGGSIYAASNHAVMGQAQTAALEYATGGTRVNAIWPRAIYTDILDRVIGGAEEALAAFLAMHPFGRVGKASEIADGVAILASDQSSFITGGSLAIDGGRISQ